MHWLILFLDLTTLPAPHGAAATDAALYRQVMADHHLRGRYDLGGFTECQRAGELSSDVDRALLASYLNSNWRPAERRQAPIHFSWIGWSGDRAWLQLTTSDATFCALYRRSGASFRLLREIRFPTPD